VPWLRLAPTVRQAGAVKLRSAAAVALLLVCTTLTSCGDDDDAAGPSTTTSTDTTRPESTTTEPTDSISRALAEPHTSVVARANVDQVPVFADASDSSEVTRTMPRHDPAYIGEDGGRVDQVFLVEDYRDGWLEVLLPVRPNGTTGWIRLGDVTVSSHDYEIVVELGAHRLTTTKGGEVIQEADIAVGTTDTPTPGGRFFLNALLRPPDPDTVYGTFAYALSGYSATLQRFAGGDGVIGIHGTNDPSVMGSDVSHGCIRMRNEDIEVLAAQLPLGTPVEIRA
jgi:lipoprotein-anchoring transpeptidase ErfK/SrfK